MVDHVRTALHISERRACRVIEQPRSAQRRVPGVPDDEEQLTAEIVALARQYGRYGYRRITALLRRSGWMVNKKRMDLAPGGAQGSPQAAQARAALAGGRIMHPAAARAPQSRLVLRLRRGPDP